MSWAKSLSRIALEFRAFSSETTSEMLRPADIEGLMTATGRWSCSTIISVPSWTLARMACRSRASSASVTRTVLMLLDDTRSVCALSWATVGRAVEAEGRFTEVSLLSSTCGPSLASRPIFSLELSLSGSHSLFVERFAGAVVEVTGTDSVGGISIPAFNRCPPPPRMETRPAFRPEVPLIRRKAVCT